MNTQKQLIQAPIGIDLGSWTSKIAVAKRGGVQVITNQANFRQTPCVVGYGSAQRYIGEAGNIKMKSNFKDSIVAPMRYLGLSSEYPALRAQSKFNQSKLIRENGKIYFEVNYQGKKQRIEPEQAMAAYLNKLKQIMTGNGFDDKSAVLAVPSYLTQAERKAYLNAAKIADLDVVRLLNDSTAIALDYGLFRKSQLHPENARNVLFIDFGHSKLSTFTCSFTSKEMSVLEQDFQRNLGCRDIDYLVYEFYREVFEKSSGGQDINQNRKAIVKIMENIQRQRKILSGNHEHDLNVEYLMEECDLQYTMKREKFQSLAKPVFDKIKNVLQKMKATLAAKKINLHSVELLGGGSRIPFFRTVVKQVFGLEPAKTLNSSQSVARGCALMAAIKSPLFKVQEEKLNERVYYGVKIFWNFVEGNKLLGHNSDAYPEKQRNLIYPIGACVPTSKTVKFTRKQGIQVLIEYQKEIPGFQKLIGYYVTKAQNPKQQIFGVTFKVKYNEDGIVTFDDCNLYEQWIEETNVPKKKELKKSEKKENKEDEKKEGAQKKEDKKEGEQKMEEEEFEKKKSKKEQYTLIKYEANNFDALTPKEIENYHAAEFTMLTKDRTIIETYEKKNQLESMIYSWKEKLTSTHQQYVRQEDIPPIMQLLNQLSQWLEKQGSTANRGACTERIESLKGKIEPIKKRFQEFEKVHQELTFLENSLKFNFEFANSLDKKYEHITPEERQEVFNHIDKVRDWMSDAYKSLSSKPRWQDPVVTVKQIRDQTKQITDKTKQIMNKPKKVEEKPANGTTNPAGPADPANPANPANQKMEVQEPKLMDSE